MAKGTKINNQAWVVNLDAETIAQRVDAIVDATKNSAPKGGTDSANQVPSMQNADSFTVSVLSRQERQPGRLHMAARCLLRPQQIWTTQCRQSDVLGEIGFILNLAPKFFNDPNDKRYRNLKSCLQKPSFWQGWFAGCSDSFVREEPEFRGFICAVTGAVLLECNEKETVLHTITAEKRLRTFAVVIPLTGAKNMIAECLLNPPPTTACQLPDIESKMSYVLRVGCVALDNPRYCEIYSCRRHPTWRQQLYGCDDLGNVTRSYPMSVAFVCAVTGASIDDCRKDDVIPLVGEMQDAIAALEGIV